MEKILIGTAERAEELVWWRFGWTKRDNSWQKAHG
jgi:hypothetical protein